MFNLFKGIKKAKRLIAKVTNKEYRKRVEREQSIKTVAKKAIIAIIKYLAIDLLLTLLN